MTKTCLYLFGLKFTLRTDHKPLLMTFVTDSSTPVLAATRLQRWSLPTVLIRYQYEIEFNPSAEVASSNALSRLPLQYRKDASVRTKFSRCHWWNYSNTLSLFWNRTPNCPKSSSSKGSRNDPEWLACPLLHYS